MTIIKGFIVIINLAIACVGGNGISQVEMTYDVPAGTVHAVQYGDKIMGELEVNGEKKLEIVQYHLDENGELLPTSIYDSYLPLERA